MIYYDCYCFKKTDQVTPRTTDRVWQTKSLHVLQTAYDRPSHSVKALLLYLLRTPSHYRPSHSTYYRPRTTDQVTQWKHCCCILHVLRTKSLQTKSLHVLQTAYYRPSHSVKALLLYHRPRVSVQMSRQSGQLGTQTMKYLGDSSDFTLNGRRCNNY